MGTHCKAGEPVFTWPPHLQHHHLFHSAIPKGLEHVNKGERWRNPIKTKSGKNEQWGICYSLPPLTKLGASAVPGHSPVMFSVWGKSETADTFSRSSWRGTAFVRDLKETSTCRPVHTDTQETGPHQPQQWATLRAQLGGHFNSGEEDAATCGGGGGMVALCDSSRCQPAWEQRLKEHCCYRSGAQSCPTLCDPMNCSCHHQRPEFTQTHVHRVGDAIQPSHPLSSPSPAFNLSPHQGVFQWVSSSHQVARVLEHQLQHQLFQGIFRVCFLCGWLVGSPCSPRDSQESSPTPQFKNISSLVLSLLYGPAVTFIHDYWKNHSSE